MPSSIALAPHFGVFHLNLPEAGMLIAKCLWFRGEVQIKKMKAEPYSFFDTQLEKHLVPTAKHYTALLTKAILDNRLQTAKLQRTPDGDIVAKNTYLEAVALADWLEDCGITLGEAFEEEYIPFQENLARKIAITVKAEVYKQTNPEEPDEASDHLNSNAEKVFLTQRIIELENRIVELKSAPPAHSPVSEKQRGSYLNIIGSLIGLLLGASSSGKPYSSFKSQQAIIDAIHGHFGEAAGLSQRNLVDKFAEGKRTLAATKKL